MSTATLGGSDKYRQASPRRGSPLIEQANAVSIFDVLRDFMGIDIPNTGSKSWKTDCPFNFEHGDGGRDKGWRVYPSTNSSYCFVLHGVLDPVRLIMLRKDLSAKRAAYVILENYGLLKSRNYRERYDQIVAEREMRSAGVGQPAVLVEALHSSVRADPRYIEKQFDVEFNVVLEKALEELDVLLARKADGDEVRVWFVKANADLSRALAS